MRAAAQASQRELDAAMRTLLPFHRAILRWSRPVGLTMSHNEERTFRHALCLAREGEILRCLVQTLLAHRKGSPVHTDAAPDAQFAMDPDRFVRTNVGVPVPDRLVGANADRGEVEAVEVGPDILDVLRIPKVAGEEERKAWPRDRIGATCGSSASATPGGWSSKRNGVSA
jgi:hypothetical protein